MTDPISQVQSRIETLPVSPADRATFDFVLESAARDPVSLTVDRLEAARLSLSTDPRLPLAHRLIVLVPDQDTDDGQLARCIWGLAESRGLAVTYLAICSASADELRMRRRLATLAAITRDQRVQVETQLRSCGDWIANVRITLRDGDIVVCQTEQRFGRRGPPLSEALVHRLGAPVCILSGFWMDTNTSPSNSFARLISWVVSIAIVLGFFWMQVRIVRIPEGWANNALLYISIVGEFGLIWLLNRVSP